jgi:hypothetical protein
MCLTSPTGSPSNWQQFTGTQTRSCAPSMASPESHPPCFFTYLVDWESVGLASPRISQVLPRGENRDELCPSPAPLYVNLRSPNPSPDSATSTRNRRRRRNSCLTRALCPASVKEETDFEKVTAEIWACRARGAVLVSVKGGETDSEKELDADLGQDGRLRASFRLARRPSPLLGG